MTISFNGIPTSIRTPGVYAEIDPSRALQGLAQNPHVALIIAQKIAIGTAPLDTIKQITNDRVADGFFGPGSIAARMCNKFKENNPNTELHAMVLGSGIAGNAASAEFNFSEPIAGDTISNDHTWYININGTDLDIAFTSNMSGQAMASAVASAINSTSTLPVVATVSGGEVGLSAVNSGTLGNYISVMENYRGQEIPSCFSNTDQGLVTIGSGGVSTSFYVSFAGGTVDPDLGDAWGVIAGEQYHYIITPYFDTANLVEIETELSSRFGPLEDLQGHGFTAVRESLAGLTSTGTARNSPHNTITGIENSPNTSEEWAAAFGAIAAWNLNNDPARPLHFLKLAGILPPPVVDRFERSERDVLLYDGIATTIVDTGGNVLIERAITTYQTNAAGLPDASFLDVNTLATLGELRYQFKVRMTNRFIVPRFKLADDTFPVQPGQNIATPKTVKAEIVALFTTLQDVGLIENLEEFIDNLIVQRNLTDRNRIDVLLPPDLVNQFRVLAAKIQFIL